MKLPIILFLFIFCAFGLKGQTTGMPADVEITTFIGKPDRQLVFYLSGDGGMNSFSRTLCKELSLKGYPVVALDSRKYFWKQKSAKIFADDLEKVIPYYLKKYGKKEFSIIGYSFGADAGILLAPRLTSTLQDKIKSLVFLSPSKSTDLEIKVSDMLGFNTQPGKYKILPELYKSPAHVLCIFGKEEESDLYTSIERRKDIEKILLPGSHKYGSDMTILLRSVEKGLYF